MSLVDLRAYALPAPAFHMASLALMGSDPAISLSEHAETLSREDREAASEILREVAAMLGNTPGAAGSMRRRLGLIVDCLIAVCDQLDGEPDLEDGADLEPACEDEGAQCDDEGAPDDNGLADGDGAAEQGFPSGAFAGRGIA